MIQKLPVCKHVIFLQKSNLLNDADTRKSKRGAKKFKINIDLDEDGKVIFPKDRRACKNILYYQNEQFLRRTNYQTTL
jgi:hypothetical protein